MELEPKQDKSPEITNPDRFAASTRRITMMPVHENVSPEGADGQIVASHITSAPLANLPIDEESTAPAAAQPQTTQVPAQGGKNTHKIALAVSITVVVVLIAITAVAFALVSN